jgi:hypothetical protein
MPLYYAMACLLIHATCHKMMGMLQKSDAYSLCLLL